MKLNLLVIRSKYPKQLSEFYEKFGMVFIYHKHGSGPYHYSTTMNGLVLEIYPLLKSQEEIDKGLRLGFEVEKLDFLCKYLLENNVEIVSQPIESEWGRRCVLKDIEGRKIELIEKK